VQLPECPPGAPTNDSLWRCFHYFPKFAGKKRLSPRRADTLPLTKSCRTASDTLVPLGNLRVSSILLNWQVNIAHWLIGLQREIDGVRAIDSYLEGRPRPAKDLANRLRRVDRCKNPHAGTARRAFPATCLADPSKKLDGLGILLVQEPRLLNNKGWRIRQPPMLFRLRSGFPQAACAAFAATAIAGVTTFTLICFGFVSSRFGMCNVSAPF